MHHFSQHTRIVDCEAIGLHFKTLGLFPSLANDGEASVLHEVEFLISERKELMALGPDFKVVHRFCNYPPLCQPGEEIAAVILLYRGREFFVRLSITARKLFDYLARHPHLLQSSADIEIGLRRDPFFVSCRANTRARKIGRRVINKYVRRLRLAFKSVFDEVGLKLDPSVVLVSEKTETNETLYQLRARIQWEHI